MRSMKIAGVALVASLMLLSGCATTTLLSNWDDPNYTAKAKKILVIGLSKNETNRAKFETTMAAAMKAEGADAVPSATVLPEKQDPTRESVTAAIEGKGYDTVMVIRMVSAEVKQRYIAGQTYVPPAPHYHGFNDYYLNTYPMVYSSGYLVNDTIVKLETNVYETASGKLVWAVVSESFNPENVSKEIELFTKLIVEQLKKDGML